MVRGPSFTRILRVLLLVSNFVTATAQRDPIESHSLHYNFLVFLLLFCENLLEMVGLHEVATKNDQ